jgi:hypothetical protein
MIAREAPRRANSRIIAAAGNARFSLPHSDKSLTIPPAFTRASALRRVAILFKDRNLWL